MNHGSPPRLFHQFLQWFCREDMLAHVEGDLLELHRERIVQIGKRRADLKFVVDVLLLLRPGMIRKIERYRPLNQYDMLKNYIKIALRNLTKSRAYSFINITGLATGMCVAMLIGLWMLDEVSYDSQFENNDRLARVMVFQSDGTRSATHGTVAIPFGDALRTKFGSDFKRTSLASWESGHLFTLGDKKLNGRGMWVQAEFPQIFSFKMISGKQDALQDPSSMMISESLSRSLFGEEDPLGKMVIVDDKLNFAVGGVFKDLPVNSSFSQTNVILPWENQANGIRGNTDWLNHCAQLFVQLEEGIDLSTTSEKIRNVPTPYATRWNEEILLFPFSDLYLYGEFDGRQSAGGRITYVRLFGVIGIFVLLLACINFMNLSTARSEKRAKEVGIRKSIGSVRKQLIAQFLSESILIAFLAFIVSIVLAQLSLPFFNFIAGKNLSLPWSTPAFWLLALGFTLFTGLLAGSYPAFYLSSFNPITALKGALKVGRMAIVPRKVLVVIQFTVSITLIIGTIIVYSQVEHARERNAGYERGGLIFFWMSDVVRNHYDVLREELLQTGAVENMAMSSQPVSQFSDNNSIDWRGKDPDLVEFFKNVTVTPEFGKTIGWSITMGRDFSRDFISDSNAVIVNRRAAEIMGFDNPIGEIIQYQKEDFRIIGVSENMVTQSPYDPIDPAIFFMKGWVGALTIRLSKSVPTQEALLSIEKVFKKHNPGAPFGFNFVDQAFAVKFGNEERVGSIAGFFSALAILISCLGLFGLSSFVAEQRTKEIGIRKILGASVLGLWKMLSKEFVLLVMVASCIALPLAIVFMNKWLQNFEYRVDISWSVFILTITGVVAITLLTVSFQALRSATANPVNSLRSE